MPAVGSKLLNSATATVDRGSRAQQSAAERGNETKGQRTDQPRRCEHAAVAPDEWASERASGGGACVLTFVHSGRTPDRAEHQLGQGALWPLGNCPLARGEGGRAGANSVGARRGSRPCVRMCVPMLLRRAGRVRRVERAPSAARTGACARAVLVLFVFDVRGQHFVLLFVCEHVPSEQHHDGVTREFDHVAAVTFDQRDDRTKIVIQVPAERFHSHHSLVSQPLRQRREAAHVNEHDGAFQQERGRIGQVAAALLQFAKAATAQTERLRSPGVPQRRGAGQHGRSGRRGERRMGLCPR